jgi:hypothetical protein
MGSSSGLSLALLSGPRREDRSAGTRSDDEIVAMATLRKSDADSCGTRPWPVGFRFFPHPASLLLGAVALVATVFSSRLAGCGNQTERGRGSSAGERPGRMSVLPTRRYGFESRRVHAGAKKLWTLAGVYPESVEGRG